mgnify:CR=1 FL=1|jgi:hypothetical protein
MLKVHASGSGVSTTTDSRDTSAPHCRMLTILFELCLQWYDVHKRPISIDSMDFLMTEASRLYEEEYVPKQDALPF